MSVALLQQQAGPRVLGGTVLGIDVANYQGDLYDELAMFPDVRHVVVRIGLSVEPADLDRIARRQVAQARESGRTVGFYFWCYRNVPSARSVVEAVNFIRSVHATTPVLWLDLETYMEGTAAYDPGPDALWLRDAVSMAGALRQRVGLYSGLWWIDEYFPGGQRAFREFAHLPIWLAQYDGLPTLDNVRLPLGWTVAHGKQYSGSPVDRNVFRRDVT